MSYIILFRKKVNKAFALLTFEIKFNENFTLFVI